MSSHRDSRADVILIATHETDVGADLVIRHLIKKSANYVRIDTNRLGTPGRHFGFANGDAFLRYDDSLVHASDVQAVWARRFVRPDIVEQAKPEYRDFVSRELTHVTESFLDAIDAPRMNSYEADRKAGNRLLQSALARKIGFVVPDTLVTQDANQASAFIGRFSATITKAVSFGIISSDRDEIAHTSRINGMSNLAGLAGCPVLIQPEIEKKHEWRVTTVGHRVFAARTRRGAAVDQLDWRRSEDVGNIFEKADIPRDVSDKLLLLCKRSAIQFGAHDLIEAPNGDFYFLETNPAGQWGWLEVHLGLPIGEAIASWLTSADGRS
jgi:glutathione synthase/RimK-type ligase-like ATP-grasp enzyme